MVCGGDTVTHISTIKIDTIIEVFPPDTFVFEDVYVNCDTANMAQLRQMYLKTKDYSVWLRVVNGNLTARIERLADSIELYTLSKADTVYTVRVVNNEPVAFIPKIYGWSMWFSICVLGLLLAYIIYRIVKYKYLRK